MKHFINIYIAIIFYLIAISHSTFGQQHALDSLTKKFDRYREQALQEKLYVHLDKNFYLTGETLWFKIYVVDGTLHKPLDVSKVAYLEVLDKHNIPVLQSKVALKGGHGNGSLFLPASLNSGSYSIRFYTHWMQNMGPEFYFQKSITIVNPFIKLEPEKAVSANQYQAEFFPEGGNLVAGLESKVAFKVSDRSGNGIEFHGTLLDEQGDSVITFKPLKFGIGHFYFTPIAGHHYRVRIKDSNGVISTHKFPDAYTSGYVMKVDDSDARHLTVSVTGRLTNKQASLVYLFVHDRQMIIRAEAKELQDSVATFLVDKNTIAAGINHFTVFDADLQPICERLYFKQPAKALSVNIASDQKEYGIRRKVTLTLQANTGNQHGTPATLSMAVYKVDSLVSSSHTGIFPYLWLSSDLKGIVESPEYYFSAEKDVNQAADNLMLTHGWRRFKWNDILDNKTSFSYIPEYHGHIIKGKVVNNNGVSNAGIVTYLSAPGKIIRFYGSRSNAAGDVFYEVKDLWGPRQIVVQTNTEKDDIYRVEIQNSFSTQFSTYPLPSFQLSPAIKQTLLTRSIAMQTQDIYYEGQANKFIRSVTDSLAFYGRADETYYLDDFTRFQVMEEVMREYVPGVLVRKRKDGFHFIVIDNLHHNVLPDNPMVLLDGVPIFDVDKIMDFDPLKVKKLEVLTRKYYLGSLTLFGIVSYSTYHGDLGGFQLDPKSLSLNYEGLQLQREFYTPRYDTPAERNSRIPDQRNLLHWTPTLVTDKAGKQQLEFYTSDLAGNYVVMVEGITTEGLSGSASYTFVVKRFDN